MHREQATAMRSFLSEMTFMTFISDSKHFLHLQINKTDITDDLCQI